MAGFKKILLEGDVASLSTNTPASVGTTPSAGSGTAASRDDHVHDLGAGCIDASNLFAAGVVDATAIATGAVGADEIASNAVGAAAIDETATDITFKQIILTPSASGTGTTEGTMYYNSDDDHVYIYTGT